MEQLLALGDIHGEYEKLITIIKRYELENAYIIQVGDFGVGFENIIKETRRLKNLNKYLLKRNIIMYAIRGNHDNPVFFNGWPNDFMKYYTTVKKYEESVVTKVIKEIESFDNIKFVEDYTVLDIFNNKLLCIGGALSVDRKSREENKSWWPNETLDLDINKLNEIERVDYLFLHTAPKTVHLIIPHYSNVDEYSEKDDFLIHDLEQEKKDADIIYKKAIAKGMKQFYCGHFHKKVSMDIDGIPARIIDINEFVSII